MKKLVLVSIIIVSIIFVTLLYYLVSPLFIIKEANESIPVSEGETQSEITVISQGNLIPADHEVSGKALIIESNGKKYLRFEDLDTVNGPDLRIYLSKDLEAKELIDLGEIKATKGDVNYELPEGINIEGYDKALIWCRAFKVLFSYAELQ